MIPEQLRVRNFLCYREGLPPLHLDGIHVACLSGENGAGKSALLDAITWALWGKARASSDDDLISLGAQEMEVELTFRLSGERFRVLRKRSSAGRGKSMLELHGELPDGGWRTLSGSTLRESQDLINELLRMGYDTFINSAFLVQGKADEFTSRPPADRKRVLAEILGLDEYERLETRAKERVSALREELLVLDARLDELRRQSSQREFFAGQLERSEQRVNMLQAQHNVDEAQLNELRAKLAELDGRRALRQSLRERQTRLDAEQARLSARAAELRVALADAEGLLRRRDDIEAGMAALERASADLDAWDERRERWYAIQEQGRAPRDELKALEARLRSERDLVAHDLQTQRAALSRRPELTAALERASAAHAELSDLAETREQRREARATLEQRERELHELALERTRLQSQLDLRRNSLVAAREEHARRIDDLRRRLKDEPRWRQDVTRHKAQLTELERASTRLAALRARATEAAALLGERRAASQTIAEQGKEIRRKLELLQQGEGACPLCGSELGHDGMAHVDATYQQEREALLTQYQQAKDESAALEKEQAEIERELADLEALTARLQPLVGTVAQLEERIAEAATLRAELNETQLTAADLDSQIKAEEAASAERIQLTDLEHRINAMGGQQGLARQREALDRELADLDRRLARRASAEAEVLRLRSEIAALDSQSEVIPRLEGQLAALDATLANEDFGHEHRALMDRLRAQIAELGYSKEGHADIKAQVDQLQHWTAEQSRLLTALANLERTRQELGEHQERLADIEEEAGEVRGQLAEVELLLAELPALERRVREGERALADLRAQLDAARAVATEHRTNLRNAEEAAAQMAQQEGRRAALLEQRELHEELVRAFGKKGVQAMLIETAIPELEREANALLARMTDNQMHVTFETQGTTKKGDTTETLDIKIADLQGTRDYSLYSGGEAFRVNFAIRIALSKLLARRAGANLQTLILDEGFGTQDGRGRERIVEAITSIQSEFARILVITHIQELKDLFPTHIEIVKTSTGSRWDIA